MTDMLVKLYDLENDWRFVGQQADQGITIRKPIAPEKGILLDWVRRRFSDAWHSEADVAMNNRPVSCFIALESESLVGFACYDTHALGFCGPIGVAEDHRGRGTGRSLLLACLLDMKLKGYGYAIIGFVGPAEFYRKTVGAMEIPDSTPGIWEGWLHREK